MPEYTKYVPQRTCIACRAKKNPNELIRITLSDNKLVVDGEVKAKGRGCYICKSKECFDLAVKKNAFQRNFKRSLELAELQSIGRYLDANK